MDILIMQSGECKLIETYAGGKMFETLCLKKYTLKKFHFFDALDIFRTQMLY